METHPTSRRALLAAAVVPLAYTHTPACRRCPAARLLLPLAFFPYFFSWTGVVLAFLGLFFIFGAFDANFSKISAAVDQARQAAAELVVAPPMSKGRSKPSRSSSLATWHISSSEGVIKPLKPIT